MGIVVTVGIAGYLFLALLTALGSRRRGETGAAAVLGCVVFPVAWTVWYVRDELLPRRRA